MKGFDRRSQHRTISHILKDNAILRSLLAGLIEAWERNMNTVPYNKLVAAAKEYLNRKDTG